MDTDTGTGKTRSAAIFEIGRNCWRIEKATYASVLVDYANYYRALYLSISKAKHSIFVLGWDIDGRIELLRGSEAEGREAPTSFFELIHWKAEKNPELQIYLNKWNFSLFFMQEREPLAGLRWHKYRLPNIHYCTDAMLPVGACHHQKIVIVDDEVAFCGGMDIAPGRWDHRQHHPVNDQRFDLGGIGNRHGHVPFDPYHDIQIVVAGPAAYSLAEHTRERWRHACLLEPVPLFPHAAGWLPQSWPDSDPPDFENIDVAIARTSPPLKKTPAIREIEQMYLDEIGQAERFIYMENQFYTRMNIAEALNRRLREKPGLRVLCVGRDRPAGLMERKSSWTYRIPFRETLTAGVRERAAIVYPISCENGVEKPVKIHSKLMAVDDRFLHIGSSNINNRSMALDTECDLVLHGIEENARRKIAAVRTDLIREHSGRDADETDRLIAEGAPIERFLEDVPKSRQHFRPIDDSPYRREAFASLARRIADCEKPLLPGRWTLWLRHRKPAKLGVSRPVLATWVILMIAAGLIFSWRMTPLAEIATMENVRAFIGDVRDMPAAPVIMVALFVVAGLCLFPLTVMVAGTAAVFGAAGGFAIALAGALLSAAAGYAAGKLAGRRALRHFMGSRSGRIDRYLKQGGIFAVTAIRMLPVAPFGAVNLAMGVSTLGFGTYICGTLFGLLPGIAAISFLGGSIARLWAEPDAGSLGMLALAAALWGGMIWLTSKFVRKWQKTRDGYV